ncbi:MAG: trans-sulfuration enzyme family protein, partial [Candidatus Bipolaricaulia bacterium]
MEFETRAVHQGQEPDPATGAVVPPIHQSSTYALKNYRDLVEEGQRYIYSRVDNPNRADLEETLAALEGGRFGLAFASGMAAISAVVALLKPDDKVVICEDVYGGTYRLFEEIIPQYRIERHYLDLSQPDRLEIDERTRMIWLESPTNPLLKIYDIATVAVRKDGALLVVDNTFATPYLQNPLALGADIVVHSTTKYLGGHSDLVGGAVVLSDERLYERLRLIQIGMGAVPGPFDCWLTRRGIKTLPLRMERHSANARRVAEFLAGHRKVARVYYPGLAAHPGHEVAKGQMRDFGGMVAFELDGDLERFFDSLKIFKLAPSLGGV